MGLVHQYNDIIIHEAQRLPVFHIEVNILPNRFTVCPLHNELLRGRLFEIR